MPAKPLAQAAWASSRAPYMLLIPILLVGLLPGPVLLGIWESLTFYHTFGAVDAPLSFLIAPRANIGGQGYAMLEMARAIILDLHLPLNLFTFRIPALAFGAASLALFFTICRRYFGLWPAIGATALLAGNQVFFQVEHTMTVLVVSGAALLFVIERLQALEVGYWRARTWAGFALSMVLVSLHYGPARIFAVMLTGLWLVKVHWLLSNTTRGRTVLQGIWILGGYSVAMTVAVLTLLDYRNLISLLRFPSFLFPRNAETMEFANNVTGEGGFLKMLAINSRILVDSIFVQVGNYHSQYSSNILADFRYPLLDRFVLPFAIFGLIVSVMWTRRRTIIFATPWGNALALLAAFAIPILSSSVVFKSDGPLATLSINRMYFCLFPLHLLVAAFLGWLGEVRINKIGRYGVALCVTAVFASLIVNLMQEHSRFEYQVFAPTWQKHGPEIRAIWDDHMPNVDRRDLSGFSHPQQHAQYANVARQLAAKLRMLRGDVATGGTRRIIYVDVNNFSEAPVVPIGLDYIANRNFHSIFLALYTGQEGVNVNPVVMVDPSRKPISPYMMSGVAYEGKPREY